jgi:hypothetical protein
MTDAGAGTAGGATGAAGPGGSAPAAPAARDTHDALIRRLVTGRHDTFTRVGLECELTHRVVDATQRAAIVRVLQGYAHAAPEYVDEDTQAAARHYLSEIASWERS